MDAMEPGEPESTETYSAPLRNVIPPGIGRAPAGSAICSLAPDASTFHSAPSLLPPSSESWSISIA